MVYLIKGARYAHWNKTIKQLYKTTNLLNMDKVNAMQLQDVVAGCGYPILG